MMSWILLFVVLLALIVIGTWASAAIFGRGTVMETPDKATDVTEGNLRALHSGSFDDLRFDVAPRGYRQDQVDELLAAVEALLKSRPELLTEQTPQRSVPVGGEKTVDWAEEQK